MMKEKILIKKINETIFLVFCGKPYHIMYLHSENEEHPVRKTSRFVR